MKKFFNTVVVLIAFHSINISSQDQVEEIIVTSAFIDMQYYYHINFYECLRRVVNMKMGNYMDQMDLLSYNMM